MPLFSVSGGKLQKITEQNIDLEKDIQKITEQNLEVVFGLKFVSTEFALNNLRIDTLAFDEESRSFVIIEYKRDRSFSVVDQGFAYLALMLNNKADFILEYNENSKTTLKREDIDWSQSRVIFIANSFTTYQQAAISFKDLQFELWEAKKYDNNTLLYNQLKSDKSSESIKTVTKNSVVNSVSKEIKTYTVDDHFKPGWENSKEIYDALRDSILNIDSRIIEQPKKHYIGYKIDNYLFITLQIYKLGVEVQFKRTQPQDLKDPEQKAYYIKDSMKYYNQHLSGYTAHNLDEIDYCMMLIRQAYKRHIQNFS